jgi:two-component system CheB/CheR fusion protein
MSLSSINSFRSYLTALVAVALATAIRVALDPLLGDRLPFVTFFVVIIAVAWYGGFGPTVLAVCLSWLAIDRFLLGPRALSQFFGTPWQLAFPFFLIGLTVALLGEALHAARRRAQASASELRRVLEELRAGQERLRTTLASIADAVITTDHEGRVTTLNLTAERLTGWGAAEAIGHPLNEVFHLLNEATEASSDLPLANCVRRGEAVSSDDQKVLVAKDLTERWIEHNAAPIKNERGSVSGTVIVFRDITARKRSEQALQQSEEQYRAVYSQAATGIGEADLTGRIVRANDRYCEIVGYPREELLGRRITDITHADDRAEDRRLFQRLIDGGPNYTVEKRYIRSDGSTVWARVAASLIRDGASRPARVAAVIEDITDRKQSQGALREQAERLRLALDSGRMGTWDWDIRTNGVVWSDNLEDIHGLPRGTFDGTFEGFTRLIHPEDWERVQRAIEDSIEQRSIYEVEFRNVWPDGSIHWMSGRGMVFTDERGEPIRMTGTAMDITERKQFESSLREADRRKEEFLAVLSHELRNPLAPIQTSLDIMSQAGTAEVDFQRERAVVERQVQHLTRLVDDLLDVSRISLGRIELHKKIVVLSEAITEVIEAVKSRIDERRQQLDVSLPERSIRLEADPTRLEQILSNLLTNASKYTDIGGRIWLTAERDEDSIVVSVRDTGIGIPPEVLPRIFGLFVQGERRLDQAQGGMGIGLSLVKALVEQHGGSIAAHSEGPGKGSEFVVRLPALSIPEGGVSDTPLSARSSTPAIWNRHRILIVDDNAVAADSLGRLLALVFGQEVRVVYDGPTALDVAESFQPEIVLLDLGMATMDGYEVAVRLRERPQGFKMRIVAVTGWGQEEDRRRSREMGFDLHLVKPVNAESLRRLLADMDVREDDVLALLSE